MQRLCKRLVTLAFAVTTLGVFAGLQNGSACYIAGADTGECLNVYEEVGDTKVNVFDAGCNDGACTLFCGEILSPMERICIPRPDPAFPDHTYQTKDAWVKDMYERVVTERKNLEMNETLRELGVDEYGQPGSVPIKFWNGDPEDPNGTKFAADDGGTDLTDCERAYHNYLCYINFPRCDAEENSLILCRSVCENYMNACHQPADLYRCGHLEYLGAHEPEGPQQNTTTGLWSIYYRAKFPGAPFRDYSEDTSTDPVTVHPVCTPSVKGDASRQFWPTTVAAFTSAVCLAMLAM